MVAFLLSTDYRAFSLSLNGHFSDLGVEIVLSHHWSPHVAKCWFSQVKRVHQSTAHAFTARPRPEWQVLTITWITLFCLQFRCYSLIQFKIVFISDSEWCNLILWLIAQSGTVANIKPSPITVTGQFSGQRLLLFSFALLNLQWHCAVTGLYAMTKRQSCGVKLFVHCKNGIVITNTWHTSSLDYNNFVQSETSVLFCWCVAKLLPFTVK